GRGLARSARVLSATRSQKRRKLTRGGVASVSRQPRALKVPQLPRDPLLGPARDLSPARIHTTCSREVFVNPEDCAGFGKGENAKKYLRTDDRVERVRRAHLNDLENIVPFLGIGLLYSLSGPDLSTAILHFRLFVGARIYHTIAYLTPLPQPNRALAFFIGYGVTLSMAYRLLKSKLYL
uniref:Microsomal glutathione S-transferase 1 n=1 Tax=Capra hircus TaxID=9925 RepID=A0A8C2N6H4_CAPHI